MKLLTQWAVTSSALILIVLAARFFFKDRLSARLRYALWAIVLARLLVPFQVTLPTTASESLPVLASNLAPELAEERSIPVFPQGSRPVSEYDSVIFDMLEPGNIIPTETSMGYYQRSPDGETVTRYLDLWSPAQIVGSIWGAGTILMALVLLVSNLRFSIRLRKHRTPLATAGVSLPVYTAEGLPSPCLFGVFRPAVYVTPQAAEHPDTLRHVLAHELTHYAHKDHIWSLLRCLALALHWYNPLVWLAVILSKGDGELACDEGAVARLGEEERVPYGRTLVDMVARRSPRPGDLLSCSTAMTGGKKSIQQRVALLVKKPETVKTALFGAAAVIVLAAVFVFAGREDRQTDLYGPYRYQVRHTQAVRFAPSPISSVFYSDPITDSDLLEEALEILDSAADLLNTPEELGLDLSEASFLSPRVILLENPDDISSGHAYLLYTPRTGNQDRCYLVTPTEIGAESYAVAATLDPSAPGALAELARRQSELNRDPSLPKTMSQSGLKQYDIEFLHKAGITQLQGRPDSTKDVKFHYGSTTPDEIQLWYWGDETHNDVWVLALDANDYILRADQPIEVFNAAQNAGMEQSYEQLGPGAFAASLRLADVTSVYLSQGDENLFGTLTGPTLQTLKDLTVQALYHQVSGEYTQEKYGQYAVTLYVEKDVGYYLGDGGADGLTLSIGSEPDVVCMQHRILASPQSEMRQYVYSPELYQSIQALFG